MLMLVLRGEGCTRNTWMDGARVAMISTRDENQCSWKRVMMIDEKKLIDQPLYVKGYQDGYASRFPAAYLDTLHDEAYDEGYLDGHWDMITGRSCMFAEGE